MKSICILAVMLITNLCAGYFTGETKVNVENVMQEQNIAVAIENSANTQVVENEVIEDVKNETADKKQVNSKKQESVNQEISKNEPKQSVEVPTAPSQQTTNIDSSQSSVTEPKVEEKPNTNKNTSENKNVPVETPKPNPEPTTPTQSDLSYWCVEGGSHHVSGDGANEHGYYSSWNEAEIACMSYTQGWTSMQYKINQCACKLYYFWAIQ